jgi:hypothetical protein
MTSTTVIVVRQWLLILPSGIPVTYLPHHFPADLSDFFDEMSGDPAVPQLSVRQLLF